MSKAEIHGKLGNYVYSEDLLTSDVFQVLQYLKPEMFILEFLNRIFYENGLPTQFNNLHKWKCKYHFWPKGKLLMREPDVLVSLVNETNQTEYTIVIECKYLSTLSNYTESIRNGFKFGDQLSDQYHDLLNGTYSYLGKDILFKSSRENRYILYLTNDYQKPEDCLKSSLMFHESSAKDYKSIFTNKLIWSNWIKVWEILKSKSAIIEEFPYKEMICDLLELLELKGFVSFHGISFNDLSNSKDFSFFSKKWFNDNNTHIYDFKSNFYNDIL